MSRKTLAFGLLAAFAAGCRQEMARQPSYRPLQPSAFFADGRSARPLVEGTVARGQLRDDPHLYEGVVPADPRPAGAATVIGAGLLPLQAAVLASRLGERFAETFPFPVTEQVLDKGREQFNIFCAVCHDRIGTGHGRVVQRGYAQPPSYHTDRLRRAPVGYFFQVMTRGFGAMPDYSAQIEPADRWAIVAYIRALQLSQDFPLEDVPEGVREQLSREK